MFPTQELHAHRPRGATDLKCHLPWLMYIAQEGEDLKMDSEKQVWERV